MVASLRRRLVLILLALSMATWLIAVIVTALLARQLIDAQVDRQLTQYMDMAHHTLGTIFASPEISNYYIRMSQDFATLGGEAPLPGVNRIRGFGTQGRDQATNLWLDNRRLLVGSEAPAFPEPMNEGFITWTRDAASGLSAWRVLYRRDEALNVWIAVGIDTAYAASLGGVTVLGAIAPLLVILPLTIAILLWGVRRGLQPLGHLAEKIQARNPQLLEPIDTADVPIEIKPVVESLNDLLDRLERALASESRFTSNAAHELQTPLTAIKAEVQRYQRQGGDAGTRVMLERISARVSRATKTVTQLLTLARLDPEQEFQRERIDLGELVIDAVAEEGGVAVDRRLDVHVPEVPGLQVLGHRDWLNILVRNLVANAFRYSALGGLVNITLEQLPSGVRLVVANDCESIPGDQRQRLTERFYSPPENTAAGVGLGLSIVARIAQLHNATLHLGAQPDGRGFVATVDFATPA